MTPAAELLAAEIERAGPLPFHRFMEVALYHPAHGYYRRPRDPFGKEGDFYTAEQIQPVFGILMAARIRQLYRAMGEPRDFTVVELGAGRREMAEAFSEWSYLPVDIDGGELPKQFSGVVFSNEFFDALPVDVAAYRGGAFVGEHGSWDRPVMNGYKVVYTPFANGRPSGPAQDVVTGFLTRGDNATGPC